MTSDDYYYNQIAHELSVAEERAAKAEKRAMEAELEIQRLKKLCGRASVVIDWLMPGLAGISIPDYAELNNVTVDLAQVSKKPT